MWHHLSDHVWKLGITGTAIAWVSTVIAEGVVDPLSGGSGWAGAGLLGLVLCWLCLKHLPAKDLQLKDKDDQFERILANKDKQITDAREKFIRSIDRIADVSQINLEKVTNHCQAELTIIAASFKQELDRLFDLHERLIIDLREGEDKKDVGK